VSEVGQAPRREQPQNIATAITEVSERAAILVHEEIELAKAEVSEKLAKLMKGAVVAAAAGIFVVTALIFVLHGFAWLLYYELPVSTFAYFWGYFAMAAILLLLGALAGFVAARSARPSARRRTAPAPTRAHRRALDERIGVGRRARGGSAGASPGAGDGALMAQRSAAEIRSSIEANRAELVVSVDRLRGEVARVTDWRGQLQRHQRELVIGAAAVGALVLLRGRRRRRRRR
jgi:uncharacterized membrane protein YqjE